MGEFTGKVVVVTGGNSGIGEAIARKFDGQGAKVVIFGRDNAKLDRVSRSLKQCIAVRGDVQNLSDLDRLFQTTRDAFGSIDVLVANAGVAGGKSVNEVDEQFFDKMVDINYKGAYFTVQKGVPFLNDGASVILISSAACHGTFTHQSVYASTKAAVSMLAKCFSADLIHRGIRVNAISPGFTDTPIFDDSKASNPAKIDEYKKKIPLKRFAEASEVADAAYYLSSPQAAYIVGIDLLVDGGVASFRG